MKTIQLRRGVTEILPIFRLANKYRGIICGGYVRYMASPHLNPLPASDVDIYFDDEANFAAALEGVKKSLEVKHENEISVTFGRSVDGEFAYCPTIQMIKPKIDGSIVAKGTMEEILNNFDFTVVRAGMVSETQALVEDDFEEHETARRLVIRNIHCPISSMFRCIKYAKKGYFLPIREALKLFNDWEMRDPEYKMRLTQMLINEKGENEMTQQEIDELEKLLWVD